MAANMAIQVGTDVETRGARGARGGGEDHKGGLSPRAALEHTVKHPTS